ncbi:hypothetical protein SAMN04488492_10611 [Megasphaera elsdenii]|jgi:hypothetical protein|nr:hypothetical protein SAMN04488492_10611 [Megasphaera elsdenii]
MSKSLRKRNIEKQLNNRKEYYDREEKENRPNKYSVYSSYKENT